MSKLELIVRLFEAFILLVTFSVFIFFVSVFYLCIFFCSSYLLSCLYVFLYIYFSCLITVAQKLYFSYDIYET